MMLCASPRWHLLSPAQACSSWPVHGAQESLARKLQPAVLPLSCAWRKSGGFYRDFMAKMENPLPCTPSSSCLTFQAGIVLTWGAGQWPPRCLLPWADP